MASKLGKSDDASKYSKMFADTSQLFHSHWFNNASNTYADGGQTAQVLALKLGLGTTATRAAVAAHLVEDIVSGHANHTTSGIIGWRFQPEVLSSMGYSDVAFALMTQTTYPSFGFEILNPQEPATTIWELWDSPSEGPGMNSRDHIMFGGPGIWLHSYVGGITQTADSIGFAHAVFTPPAQFVATAMNPPTKVANDTSSAPLQWASAARTVPLGTYTLSWAVLPKASGATCGMQAEGGTITLGCQGSTIDSVSFASYGTPTGSCDTGLKAGSCAADVSALVAKQCVGKASCSVSCSQGSCAGAAVKDPCFGTAKHLAVQATCKASPAGAVRNLQVQCSLPHNAKADTVLPTLGQAAVTISEGGATVWSGGKFTPGTDGITGAVLRADAVVVSHGSGAYNFDVAIPTA